MKTKLFFKSWKAYLTVFAAAVPLCLIVFYLWTFNPLKFNLPSDKDLVTLFQAHREAFNKLRAMAIQDEGAIGYISADSLNGRNDLSESRRNEYRQLLSEIGRKFGIGAAPNQVTFPFAVGGTGLAISRTWMKGMLYLPDGNEREGTIVGSLDKLGTNIGDGIYLMPIEKNWYIVYQQLD